MLPLIASIILYNLSQVLVLRFVARGNMDTLLGQIWTGILLNASWAAAVIIPHFWHPPF